MEDNGSTGRKIHWVITEGLKGLVVAPGQTLACIVSLAVAGCLVVLSASAGSLTVSMLNRATKSALILVYLQDKVDSQRVNSMIGDISRRLDVESVEYISREQDRNRNADLLPEGLRSGMPADAIPGQHAIEVKFKELAGRTADLAELASFLKSLEGVDIVAEPPVGSAGLRAVASAVGFVRVTMSVLAAVLLIGTLFFVVGTLTRTMERRRREMSLLHLVGATSLFIKAPLYIQGITQGITGLSAGVLTALIIIKSTNTYLLTELAVGTGLPSYPGLSFALAVPGGLIVGLAGAMIASARRLP
jgi:cell division transport system permease protein